MANRFKGEVPLVADDETYTLRFSTNAICELEELLGVGVNVIATQLSKPETMTMKAVRACVWAGLRDLHPGVSIKQAGDITDTASKVAAMKAVSKAFQLSFEERSSTHPQKPGQKSPEVKVEAGTGLQS